MFTKYCNWIDIPLPIALISFLLYSIAFISTPLFILWSFPVSNHRIKTKNWIFINRKLGQTQVKCLIKRMMLVSLNPLLFFLSNKKFKLSQLRIIALCASLCAFLLFLPFSLALLEESFAYGCFLNLTCRAHAPEISVAHKTIDALHGSDVGFLRPSLFFGGSDKTSSASISSYRSSLTSVSSTRRFHSSHSWTNCPTFWITLRVGLLFSSYFFFTLHCLRTLKWKQNYFRNSNKQFAIQYKRRYLITQKINHLLHSLQLRRSGIFWRVLYNDLQPRHIFALLRS